MSFKEDHPNYKSYKSSSDYHYQDAPLSLWTPLESLIAEAGGDDCECLPVVVSKIATKVRAGHVEAGVAYQYIPDIVSKLHDCVNDGKFNVFMDCLAILCLDGELGTESLNDFLNDYKIGYAAYSKGVEIKWERIDEEDDVNPMEEKPVLLMKSDAETLVKSKEELNATVRKKIENQMNTRNSLFISHRTVDADVADMIKDFLVATGIPNDKLFCSSLPGNDVNERISPEVKEHLKNATIIIVILSKAYYESAYCINEAGVAWYLDDVITIPFGLPEIDHNNMLGFLNADYKLRRLDNDDDISYLYDQAQERLDTEFAKHGVITRELKKLKEKYQRHIKGRIVTDDPADDGEHNFGDENEQLEFYNQFVQGIRDAGGEIDNLKELADKLGITEKATQRKLQRAINEGKIITVGSGRNKKYRISTPQETPVVGMEDVQST